MLKYMDQLVDSLSTTPFTKRVMKYIDRSHFVMDSEKDQEYVDMPLPLMKDQTISAPQMHAIAIEYLEPILKPGSSLLDIGSGSGYVTACFGICSQVYHADPNQRGTVIGIDIVPELVDYSIDVIEDHYGYLFYYEDNFKLIKGDGKKGYPEGSTDELYDGIHIGARCEKIPGTLLAQLKRGGIMVIPLMIGDDLKMSIVTKDQNGDIGIEPNESVRYVPLM